MNKLATHNSGTGEKGGGLLSLLLTPFARCQGKTLVGQYRAGVRLFDIRVRKVNDRWVFAHGLWRSRDTVYSALSKLNRETYKAKEKAMLMVTYEGECDDRKDFVSEVLLWECYNNLEVVEINVRKPKWLTLARYKSVPFVQCFRVLDFSTWHTLIPIPWLWAKFENARWSVKARRCNPTEYAMIDFV